MKKFLNERFFCGLDLGAERIKVSILKGKRLDDLTLVGSHIGRMHGYKDGAVIDIAELSESIHLSVHAAMRKAKVRIKDVIVGIGSDLVSGKSAQTTIPLVEHGHKIVTSHDVNKVDLQLRLLNTKIDDEIIHNIHQSYRIDDDTLVLNPLGLYARKIELNALLVLASMNRLKNIFKAINQAGFEIKHVFFNSYAAAEAVFKHDPSSKTRALIDIGGDCTNILVFKNGLMNSFEKIEIGGRCFTEGLVKHLNISLELSEHLKKTYGSVLESDLSSEEDILVRQQNAYRHLKKKQIVESLRPVSEQLCSSILAALEHSKIYKDISDLTVIGGGAFLTGLLEEIGAYVKRPVSLGRLSNLTHTKTYHLSLLIPAIGLAEYGFRKHRPIIALTTKPKDEKFLLWISNRVTEIYQEYF